MHTDYTDLSAPVPLQVTSPVGADSSYSLTTEADRVCNSRTELHRVFAQLSDLPLHALFAFVAAKDLKCDSIDITTTFLNGNLEEVVRVLVFVVSNKGEVVSQVQ